ncbi:MAG: hypothetical protein PUB20_04630 [Clostridia bacterium]|nr:hypothetical protein [Clostridia bacterium]
MNPYVLKPHLTRKSTFMAADDERVPAELFAAETTAPNLDGFPYPLPSAKSDYTCFAQGRNEVLWLAGKSGVTRYDKNADRKEDIIMYFSARRHIPSDNVSRILADGDGLWVLTDKGVSHIEMISLTAEEKAEMLLEETNTFVKRRGMVSQRKIKEHRNLESVYPYAASDNDGTFTACHEVGELFRYATFRRELGENDPKTVDARRTATESCEACLLLMYIHGREEGFIARSYHLTGEPVPDDGIFYKRCGDTAVCVETTHSVKKGRNGEKIPCTHPVPDRLAKLYRNLGFTEDDITYKADTSSDEVTHQFLQMKLAHDILGPDDSELDSIIKDACRRTMKHIIDGGFEFREHSGESTTWAKWSKDYFRSGTGYVDAPLNAAELLMYLKVTMYITGEEGIWKETYDKLVADGYAELSAKHRDRFYQGAMSCDCMPEEDLMYGDHMLALSTFWMLTQLETDENLLKTYRKAFKTWSDTLLREHNPGYDFPYKISCPDEFIDIEKDVEWFNRFETSRLAASVKLDRHDTPVRVRRGEGDSAEEISALLPPDERFIKKYDRNPFERSSQPVERDLVIEGCYNYTFAYWIGRYYGFIAEEEKDA